MHDELAYALSALTTELREWRHDRRVQFVTRQDLRDSENRIIAAFRGISLSEAEKLTQDLRASTDTVQKAVEAHTPKQ